MPFDWRYVVGLSEPSGGPTEPYIEPGGKAVGDIGGLDMVPPGDPYSVDSVDGESGSTARILPAAMAGSRWYWAVSADEDVVEVAEKVD